jgi:NAD(P)-dependent dehydrogenase (short-subunit alcohol dehydrogenase family)
VLAARTRETVERAAAALRASGADAEAVACDVTVEADVRRLAVEAGRKGPVDLLVLSAGDAASGPLATITLEEWNRLLTVNATGTFLCVREFAPAMAERRFGRIVVIASVAGLHGGKYIAHYAAAKHAVVGFVRSVAAEFEGRNVTVNALCPGYVDTAMTARTLENVRARTGLGPEEALAAILATVGQSRLVTPAEVAAEVVRLCRPETGSVTGEAIILDGGARSA